VKLQASGSSPETVFKASRVAVRGKKKGDNFALSNFSATAKRHLGPIMEEGIAAVLFAKGSTLQPAEPLQPTSDLVIEPPAPFTGSATYRQETPTQAHWSGDLKIDMPGFGILPLAGRGSQATATVHRITS
jgi:hypothetical protein